MENYQVGILMILLCASVATVAVPAAIYGTVGLVKRKRGNGYAKSGIRSMLAVIAYLFASVLCLRYAVGYYSIITATPDAATLTWWEEIANSVVHTLQTFSMDEDYTQYILDGKTMMDDLFGEDTGWAAVYGLYASGLNVAAPIVGGAILFEILASFFPRMKLGVMYWALWKEKYFFSELNEASLALAKSVSQVKAGFGRKPVLIFTDAYLDNEDERGSELFAEAKAMGAICVQDDLIHVRKNKFGLRKFFLIDQNEPANLQAMADLANACNSRYLKKAEIYLFTNNDAYTQIEGRIRDTLTSDFEFTDDELPVFVPVKSYRNLISNLLAEIPLYTPLVGKKKNSDGTRDLTVTVIGAGHIGTEMFLSAYWIGQMLDCNLKINVLSQETEEEFWDKIDCVNPEIRHTTIKGDPILRINAKGDTAKVYCQVEYLQCDAKSSRFIAHLQDPEGHIFGTDYFLVAQGSDEDNISVANTVQTYVGLQRIAGKTPGNTVIAYVVYNPELARTLNRKTHFSYTGGKTDVYMQAVGSLQDVYSIKNVFMQQYASSSMAIDNAYNALQNRKERAAAHGKRIKDDYKYWANLARDMHVTYKAFSVGLVKTSVFDYPDAPEAYREAMRKSREAYEKLFTDEGLLSDDESLSLQHRIAWLEHRRWNAFTRVKGFRQTRDYDAYAIRGVMGSYKQMALKLHPCLVECDQKGTRAVITPKEIVDKNALFRCEAPADLDLLDALSYDLYQKQYNDYDFKLADYPTYQ